MKPSDPSKATPLVEHAAIIRRGEGMKRVLGLYLGKDKRPLLREGQKVSERDLESVLAAIEKATEEPDRLLRSVYDWFTIATRCPACFNDTLTINKGHLLCTWNKCTNPTLIDSAQPQREAASGEPPKGAGAGSWSWEHEQSSSGTPTACSPGRVAGSEPPKEERVETQEWTPEHVKKLRQKATDKRNNPLDGDAAIADAINAAFAAERADYDKLHLLKLDNAAALREHDAEVRKPLVEALQLARKWLPNSRCPSPNEERAYEIIDAAIAQAK